MIELIIGMEDLTFVKASVVTDEHFTKEDLEEYRFFAADESTGIAYLFTHMPYNDHGYWDNYMGSCLKLSGKWRYTETFSVCFVSLDN